MVENIILEVVQKNGRITRFKSFNSRVLFLLAFLNKLFKFAIYEPHKKLIGINPAGEFPINLHISGTLACCMYKSIGPSHVRREAKLLVHLYYRVILTVFLMELLFNPSYVPRESA